MDQIKLIKDFIDENYERVVEKLTDHTYACYFKHKEGLTEDGVTLFESVKKGWSNKPILPKFNYLIVDCNMTDVLSTLNTYYALDESHYKIIKEYIVNVSIEEMDKYLTKFQDGDHDNPHQ